MSKIRSDSICGGLPVEQREQLDRWLMVENTGLKEVCEKLRTEFGVEASLWSVRRYRQRCVNERTVHEVVEGQDAAGGVNQTGADLEKVRTASWRVLNTRLMEQIMATEDPDELLALGRMLSESDWAEVQRGRLELARERFEFKAAEAALEQMEKMEGVKKEELERKRAEVYAMKVGLFGRRLPKTRREEGGESPIKNYQTSNIEHRTPNIEGKTS